MPRGVKNWTSKDVVSFLKKRGFVLIRTKGSHTHYGRHFGGQFRMVTVHNHGKDSIKPRTLTSMIRQSGISKDVWLGKASSDEADK